MHRVFFLCSFWIGVSAGCGDAPPSPGPAGDAASTMDARAETDTGVVDRDANTDANAAGDATVEDASASDASADGGLDATAGDAASTMDARVADASFADVHDAGVADARDASADAATCIGDGSACAGGRIASLALGTSHTCAMRENGRVLCWGGDGRGQLGDGTVGGDRATAIEVVGIASATGIWAGPYNVCATLADDTAVCWGDGNNGRFGVGVSGYRPSPFSVTTPAPARKFALGDTFSCALLSDGTVACTGSNQYGQLGTGSSDTASVAAFTRISGLTGITDIAAGTEHACALRSDRTVVCWGRNNYMQVASSGTERRSPTELSLVSDVTALSAFGNRTCARSSDASARCWGDDGTTLSSVGAVAAGVGSVCAVRTDGQITCNGYNSFGQVGDGTTMPRATPIVIGVRLLHARLFAGFVHNCALHTDGRIECWGGNDSQQLGITAPDTCRPFGSDTPCARRPTLLPEL